MCILAVLEVAQAYTGRHNAMSLLPSGMVVDDHYATNGFSRRLPFECQGVSLFVYVRGWCTLLH